MNIKGIQKTSLVDFPGRLSSVIFFSGCNLRCRYCYNADLVYNKSSLETYADEDVLEFLNKRLSLIDGVVITGGEPTLYSELDAFLFKINEIHLAVKIDTNGTNPDVIERLISRHLIDYLAIDVKTSSDKYESLVNVSIDFNKIRKTINIVRESGIDYELRTTCIPGFVDMNDFKVLKDELGHVKRYYLQQFINKKTLDPQLQNNKTYDVSVLTDFKDYIKTFADVCEIRGI